MKYEVWFQCLFCKHIFSLSTITVNKLHESRMKDVVEALKSFYQDQRNGVPVVHDCFKNTGMPMPEEPPQVGRAVFAGLRRK